MNRVRIASYAALTVVVVALVVILTSGGGGGYKVRTEFKDVDGLRAGSTVKIDGIEAGKVSKLTVSDHSTALATLTLDKSAGPIGSGASIQIRPTDLLGERYAQLNLGNKKDPQPSNSFIPMSRTSAPVDLDNIINAVNAPLRQRLNILINEAGIALTGRGGDFNTILKELPPNLGQAQALLGQIASQNASIEEGIHTGNEDSMVVNGKRLEMGQAIDAVDSALDTVAQKQVQLGQTMQNAPSALGQLRTTLNEVSVASRAIEPAASSLTLAAKPLANTLRELPKFQQDSEQTLKTAKQVAPALTKLGRQARAPLAKLRPTAAALQSLTHNAQPILTEINGRGMADLLWFIENWELSTRNRDGIGHWVGALLTFNTSILSTAVDGFTNNTGLSTSLNKSANKKSAASKSPSTAAPTTSGTAAPENPVTKVTNGLGNAVGTILHNASGNVSSTLNGVTNGLGSTVNKVLGGGNASSSSSSGTSSGSSSNGLSHLLNFLVGK